MSFDNRDNPVKDKIEDAVFSYAGTCHIDNINKEIEQFNENTNINPNQEELDKKIQDYIRECIRDSKMLKYRKVLKKTSKIAAIVLISLAVLSTILISSVDALKVIFLNIFIEDKTEYSKITIGENNPEDTISNTLISSKELDNCYIPAYVPENFLVDKIMRHDNSVIITFKDKNSNLLFFEHSDDMNKEYMVDTEDAYKENILIQGQKAVIIIKGEITTVIWKNNEKVFNVCGQVEREEILKFCESLYLRK